MGWSRFIGEVIATNFTHFNVAFPGLMGDAVLSDADMALYRDFINTIRFEPNPNQNLDRTYPTNFAGADANAGKMFSLRITRRPRI